MTSKARNTRFILALVLAALTSIPVRVTLLLILFAHGLFASADIRPATQPFEKFTQILPGTTIAFDMIPIPAGEVDVAATTTQPAARIKVKRFWIGRTEVTSEEFVHWAELKDVRDPDERKKIVGRTRPSDLRWFMNYQDASPRGYPAALVHHKSAVLYCQWLSEKTGRKYRLPLEAEWEWACISGGMEALKDQATLLKFGWFRENAAEEVEPERKMNFHDGSAHKVAKKLPNGHGMYDMYGNAAEWVLSNDGQGTPLAKGGSWVHPAKRLLDAGAAYRQPFLAAWHNLDPQEPKSPWWLSNGYHIGFRVVCEE